MAADLAGQGAPKTEGAPKQPPAKGKGGKAQGGEGRKGQGEGRKAGVKAAGKPGRPAAGKGVAAQTGGLAGGRTPVAGLLRKKEFVDRVIARSGASKAATKDVVAATLTVLADAIRAGEPLAIAGFGKTRVNRHLTRAGADTYVLRFKPALAKDGAKGLEDDDDDV